MLMMKPPPRWRRCGIAAWHALKTPVRFVSMTSDHCPRRHVGDVREDADAGVVDEDVEAAEPRDRRVDRALDLVVAAHVGLQRLDGARARGFDLRAARRQMRARSGR